MLRKSEIEKIILDAQKSLELIGLSIKEITVKNPAVVTELEKLDKSSSSAKKKKPYFLSPKNYKGSRIKVAENEYGLFFGIKLVKD